MTNDNQKPGLGEAANDYIASLTPSEGKASQQQVSKFARWFGRERPISGLLPAEVESYAEQLSTSDKDYLKNFDSVKAFLVYAKKKGWTKTNMSVHLKIKVKAGKGRVKKGSASRKDAPEPISLTREGHAKLKAELEVLHDERLVVIAEMRKAAADKDFRENAPLHAAREKRGHLEGKIQELEGIMKAAVIIDETQNSSLMVSIGDNFVICEVGSETELCYTLVSPREVDVKKGKISNASPMGQAIIGREQGETVEIDAPVGKLYYKIVRIEH